MNPEFRRNLWLELSPHRLIALPATIAIVLTAIYSASENPHAAAAFSALVAACVLLGVWGAHSAGDAVMEEVRSRTWDTQRLSAIGPWAMAWGKLFGSTAFPWYGGAMLIAVMLVTAPLSRSFPAAKVGGLVVVGALLVQACACMAGLAMARKGVTRQGMVSGAGLVLLLFLTGPVFTTVHGEGTFSWWGHEFAPLDFALASGAAFAAWAVFGLYRNMATALQVRTLPWAFVAFLLFCTAYAAGFTAAGTGSAAARIGIPAWGFLICVAATYAMLFGEDSGMIVFRRVQAKLAALDSRGALAELPCWTVALALAAAFGIATVLSPTGLPWETARAVAYAPIPLLLLAVRDAGVVLFFAFAANPRRAEAAALFYLVLLYGLLPWLLSVVGLRPMVDYILPPVFDRPVFASVVGAAHAAIAWFAVTRRWRARRAFTTSGAA